MSSKEIEINRQVDDVKVAHEKINNLIRDIGIKKIKTFNREYRHIF